MKYTRTLTALLLASTLLTSTVHAQEPPPAPAPTPAKTNEQTAAEAELQEKALALLEEVAGEISSLKLIENRVRLNAAAAEILWTRDEARARELFNAAASDLSSVTAGVEPDDPEYYNLTNATLHLRQRLLGIIAERDPKFALEFLRATRQPPPPAQPGTNFRQPDQDLMLEAQLAQQVAARDPQQALRIAEEVLSRGLSSNLLPLLDQLSARDPEGASRLVAGIVRRLRTANFTTDYEAANIASHVLTTTRAPETVSSNQANAVVRSNNNNARRVQLDEATRRDLVNLLVGAAVGGDARGSQNIGGLLSTLRQLMPEVERYAPAQAAGVRRRLEGYERRVEGSPREYRQLLETGTTDALVEAAAKATPEMRHHLYRSAAWKALNDGNPERARQIISNNIEGKHQREQMLKELEQQMFWRAATEGKLEQAQALLARIKSADERVGMLLQLSRLTAAKGNKKAATALLDEAWNLVGGRARGQSQFFVQLQMAESYAHLAPTRGFEIVEANVMHLNELVAAALLLEGFGQEAFAQDELKGQDSTQWGSLAFQCNEALAALASADFERARAAADRFQRLELRLPARLAIARGILLKDKERNAPLRRRRGGGIGGV
ncbi:MAG TPA: hypothetical protein VGW12_19330 [Pyrinomonadaceae bacterium]|nr:hypothetical protein [Pyrinomonadaceae bacterium]